MVVWKFPLSEPAVIHMIPEGARIIHVAEQDGLPTLWALCDPGSEKRMRRFLVAGTGQEIGPQPVQHVGSLLMHDGKLVLHVFEEFGFPS